MDSSVSEMGEHGGSSHLPVYNQQAFPDGPLRQPSLHSTLSGSALGLSVGGIRAAAGPSIMVGKTGRCPLRQHFAMFTPICAPRTTITEMQRSGSHSHTCKLQELSSLRFGACPGTHGEVGKWELRSRDFPRQAPIPSLPYCTE